MSFVPEHTFALLWNGWSGTAHPEFLGAFTTVPAAMDSVSPKRKRRWDLTSVNPVVWKWSYYEVRELCCGGANG